MIKLPNNFIAPGEVKIYHASPEGSYKYPWGWYISIFCEYIGNGNCDTVTLYLHSDGKWRYTPLFFSGYYKTKEDAAAFLNSI